MLKEYNISDILESNKVYTPYFVGTFEGTEDPDIECPHRHSFYSVVWFTEGTGFYVIDFQEYEIKPQRIFLVNTKQVHNWDYSENSKGYILMVDSTIGIEPSAECHFPYIDIDDSDSSLFEQIFANLIEELNLENDTTVSDMKIGIQYLYYLVKRIAKQKQIPFSTSNRHMEQFKAMVLENGDKVIPIEVYAQKLCISVDDLNAICKESSGISAKQYLLDLKITEAKRLLLFTNQNVSEIAFQLGFEDSSYFSRIFKKKVSLSPSEFQRKYRK